MYHLSRKVVDMHRCNSTWVTKDKSSIATCKKKQLISALIGVSLCKGVLRMLNSRGPHVGMLLGEISLNIDQWEERGSAKDFSWGNSLTLEKKGLLIYSKIIFLYTTSQDVFILSNKMENYAVISSSCRTSQKQLLYILLQLTTFVSPIQA